MHGDPGVEKFLDVLPSLFVGRAGGVGVSKLVDQGNLGPASQDRGKVHFFQGGAPVGHLGSRNSLKSLR